MSWLLLLVLFAFIGVIVYLKMVKPLRVKRQELKKNTIIKNSERKAQAQKLECDLSKSTALICLQDDGKLFGPAFKNGNKPALPHTEGCKCQFLDFNMRQSQIFSKKQKQIKYRSDLGDLDFYQYKFYKYSLLIRLDPENSADYKEYQKNLPVSRSFHEKVVAHLEVK